MEIKSYADMYGFAFESWELDLLKSIDRCYLRVQMEELEEMSKPRQPNER